MPPIARATGPLFALDDALLWANLHSRARRLSACPPHRLCSCAGLTSLRGATSREPILAGNLTNGVGELPPALNAEPILCRPTMCWGGVQDDFRTVYWKGAGTDLQDCDAEGPYPPIHERQTPRPRCLLWVRNSCGDCERTSSVDGPPRKNHAATTTSDARGEADVSARPRNRRV